MNKEHKTEERYVKIIITDDKTNIDIHNISTWELVPIMMAFQHAMYGAIGDNFQQFYSEVFFKLNPDKNADSGDLEDFESFMKKLLKNAKKNS